MISYKDNIQVTSTTTGTGTLTQAAAVTGFAAPAAGDDGKTFTIMVKGVDASGIPTGEWELCESTYTHSGTTWSRGTLLDSSTGSRVTFSAGTKHIAVVAPARVFGAAGGGLEISNQTVTTADITGAVGNFYVCTIAGLTNHRSLTLPSAAVGERIGVYIADGDDTYSLIVKGASGQTISGGSAATEWSRLFIKGETAIFRVIAANTWIVESDGRIPMKGLIYLSTNATSNTAATFVYPHNVSGAWTAITNVGHIATTATGRFYARRSCVASIGHSYLSLSNVTDQKYGGSAFELNSSGVWVASNAPRNSYTGLLRAFQSTVDNFAMSAGDYVSYGFRTEETDKGCAAGTDNSFFQFKENL
jgi:hypothetical protein